MFDTSCQNTTLPLHHKQEKRVIMMDVLIFVGGVLAKGLAVGVMLMSCVAIYMVESRRVGEEA